MSEKPSKNVLLDANQTVSEAIRLILRHNLDYLLAWEPAVRLREGIEGVHQTRVAFRRMRSALNTFRKAIPREVSAHWSVEMRDLATQLGRARDLDVFIEEALVSLRGGLPLSGGDRLLALAEQHRVQAYDAVHSMLDSDRYVRFKDGFCDWIEARDWEKAELKKKEREVLGSDVVPFARSVLDRQERRVLEAGNHVHKESAAEMHRLRIECKKLRYATEFFSSLFTGMDDFIGRMKGLQDLLGVMNDVSVMTQLLRDMLAKKRNPELLEYAGGVVGWRTCHYHELLRGFDGLWEEFVEAKHPWWRKSAAARPPAPAEQPIGQGDGSHSERHLTRKKGAGLGPDGGSEDTDRLTPAPPAP